MKYEVPILLILYNRLDTTKQLVDIVRKINPRKVYVSIDGPKQNNSVDLKKVDQVKSCVLENFKSIEGLELNFNIENLGCRFGPESAIDWFFSKEREGIILEDDCHPDPSFFGFAQELLTRFSSDKRIFAICGSNLLNPGEGPDSYYFSRLFMAWGWASWRDRWEHYKTTVSGFERWTESDQTKFLLPNKVANRNLLDGAAQSITNQIDAWDFIWHITCLLNNGLIITPYTNLIKNVGFDKDATHNDGNYRHSITAEEIALPLSHPDIIRPQEKLDELTIRKIHGWFHLWEKLTSPLHIYAVLKNRFKSLIKVT